MSTTQWKKFAVENIPIPDFDKVPFDLLEELVKLVDERLALKMADHQEAALDLEREIDRVVYKVYSLSLDDIAIIES